MRESSTNIPFKLFAMSNGSSKQQIGSRLLALVLFYFLSFGGLAAQCPLICNKNVNISMNDSCSMIITADVMLEGDGLLNDCHYEVVIMGPNNVPIQGSPRVTSIHVGKTFDVKIISDHNQCWGKLTIEDKKPPQIICPDPITISCYDKRTFSLPITTIMLFGKSQHDGRFTSMLLP